MQGSQSSNQAASEQQVHPQLLASRYLQETISLGGIPMSRGQAIQEMMSDGLSERAIYLWLSAYSLTHPSNI